MKTAQCAATDKNAKTGLVIVMSSAWSVPCALAPFAKDILTMVGWFGEACGKHPGEWEAKPGLVMFAGRAISLSMYEAMHVGKIMAITRVSPIRPRIEF